MIPDVTPATPRERSPEDDALTLALKQLRKDLANAKDVIEEHNARYGYKEIEYAAPPCLTL